jgi:mRNA interferase MazF
MVKSYTPRYGDAVWITLDPQAGHEQAGRRPALVISPENYNKKTGLAVFCPITGQIKDYPFEVPIPPGLTIAGAILGDQVKSLDWVSRDAQFICTIPNETISEVIQKLETLVNH